MFLENNGYIIVQNIHFKFYYFFTLPRYKINYLLNITIMPILYQLSLIKSTKPYRNKQRKFVMLIF